MHNNDNELLKYIEKQIKYENENEKRFGITVWSLLGSIVFIGKILIEYLYKIKNTDINIYTIKTISTNIFLALIILGIYVYIFYIDSKPRRIVNRNILTEKNLTFFQIIIRLLSITIPILFVIKDLMNFHFLFYVSLLIFIINLIPCYVTYFIVLTPFHFIDQKAINQFIIFCYEYKLILKILFFLNSNILLFILYNSFLVNKKIMNITENNIICSFIINIIIFLLISLIFVISSNINRKLFTELEQEILLSKLHYDDIIFVIENMIIGESISKQLNVLIIKTENYYNEFVKKTLNSTEKVDLLQKDISEAIKKIDELYDNIYNFFKFNKTQFSITDIIYKEKYLDKINSIKLLLNEIYIKKTKVHYDVIIE